MDLLVGTQTYLGRGDGTFDAGPAFQADLLTVSDGRIYGRTGTLYAQLATVDAAPREKIATTLEGRRS